MSYAYFKPKPPPSPSLVSNESKPNLRKITAGLLFCVGFYLLYSAFWPMLSFQFSYSQKLQPVVSPLSAAFYNRSGSVLGQDITTDYTQIDNWFIGQSAPDSQNSHSVSSETYYLSVPKLKIDRAQVDYGHMDLKKSLIQYPQTAYPGQLGNPVIFGHSVLPQFFNPKSYLTIFSTLYKLKIGDEIYIDYDSVKYKYLVDEIFEVKPTDLSVLEQRFDNRYLTLVTCTPPGTYLRRLIVKAKIADL